MRWTDSITSTGRQAEFFDGVLPIDSTSRWSPQPLERSVYTDERAVWAAMSGWLNLLLDARQSDQQLLIHTPLVSRVIAPAQDVARRASNRLLARQAEQLLNNLAQLLYHLGAVDLPPLHAVEVEDGALVFEWILSDRRAAVALDPVPAQSGWYVLGDESEVAVQSWGHLDTLDWSRLIAHIQQGLLNRV